MAVKDRVTIELYVDDQGTVKIVNARKATEELRDASVQDSQAAAGAAEDFASALVKQVGIYALATAAAWKLEQAAVGAFKAGIKAEDDYRLTTIGVAATLTDLAQDQSNLQRTYGNNLAYSKEMYNELELAAAKHFASGKDLIQAWNILSMKGVVLRREEIDDLGIIVDKIKLVTQGQVASIQISQELRAMLDGQVRATDQLALMVRSRYGDAWQEIINKHREAGDLIPWLASEFKGLKYAGEDVTQTLTSQKTTLETLLSQVGRAGLGGAYEDIVRWLKDGNEYLTTHKNELAGDVAAAWIAVRNTVENTLGYIREIANITSKAVKWNIDVIINMAQPAAEWLFEQSGYKGFLERRSQYYQDMKAAAEVQGPEGNVANLRQQASGRFSRLSDIKDKFQVLRASTGSDNFYMLPNGEIVPMSKINDIPSTRQGVGDAGGGGGGGAEKGIRELMNIIDSLDKEYSHFTQGAMAENDQWAEHLKNRILGAEKIISNPEEARAKALEMLGTVKGLRDQKLEEDYLKWYYGAVGDTEGKILMERQEADRKWGADKQKQAEIAFVFEQKLAADAIKKEQEQLGLTKGYLDQMAGSAPFLSQQLALQQQILGIEAQQGKNKLDLDYYTGKITLDEWRALEALRAQTEEFKQQAQLRKAWETQGIGGGLQMWSYERLKEMESRAAKETMDYLKKGEAWLGQTFGQSAWDTLLGKKADLKKLFQDIMGSAILELNKMSVRTLFDAGAGLLGSGQKGGTGMGVGGGADQGLIKAGQSLQKAGLGFNRNTAQFGLAAGGLLLSGLGIMTNSQALVIAGTVLQLAGLAIQLYQALTATEQAAATTILGAAGMTLGVAGGNLLAAAAALTIAAEVMAVGGIFHSGGLIAHTGLLVAHGGLALDERLIIAQTGEGIIQRSAMSAYARAGISFDMLNSGKLPVAPVPVPVGGDNGRPVVNNIGPIHVVVPVNKDFSGAHGRQVVRKFIIPAIEDELSRKGLQLGSS